jgi:hypothetical protein
MAFKTTILQLDFNRQKVSHDKMFFYVLKNYL